MTEKYIEIGFVSLLNQIFESFQEEYKGQANFHITFAAQSESNCKDVLMGDLEAGADVFAFADDQLNTLVAAGGKMPAISRRKICPALWKPLLWERFCMLTR